MLGISTEQSLKWIPVIRTCLLYIMSIPLWNSMYEALLFRDDLPVYMTYYEDFSLWSSPDFLYL